MHIVIRPADNFSQIETRRESGFSTPNLHSISQNIKRFINFLHVRFVRAQRDSSAKSMSRTFWHAKCTFFLLTRHSESRHPHLKKVGSLAFFGRAVALPLTRLTMVGRSCRVETPLFLRGVPKKPLLKGCHLTLSNTLRYFKGLGGTAFSCRMPPPA